MSLIVACCATRSRLSIIAALAIGAASPATAATFLATGSNFAAVFAKAGSGDTIKLSGNIGQQVFRSRSFAQTLTIDARDAVFTNRLSFKDVNNVSFIGGTYGTTDAASTWQNGYTITVTDGSNVRFDQPTLIANSAGKALGISLRGTSGSSVNQGSFDGFRLAVGLRNADNIVLSNNNITGQTSDGFNIVSSHFVNVTGNSCSGPNPSAGAHPDCVQMWSLAGEPVQSDITITGNRATGYMQGFTSFDPARGGGLRINISNNYLNTSYPQGIACYACVDSRFADNVLLTLPGARWATRMTINGSNNVIANNRFGAGPALQAGGLSNRSLLAASEALTAGRSARSLLAASEANSMVPEPWVWLQMITGFTIIGLTKRRRMAVAA